MKRMIMLAILLLFPVFAQDLDEILVVVDRKTCNSRIRRYRTNKSFELYLPKNFEHIIHHHERACLKRYDIYQETWPALSSSTKPTPLPSHAPSTYTPTQKPTYSPITPSLKKGIAHSGRNGTWLSLVNPKWYYNWRVEGTVGAEKIPFIPMVWGRGLGPITNASIILGFNEPDFEEQSSMTPKEALDLWPKTVSVGAQLVGSPSPGLIENFWLREFLNGAMAANQKVDFICLHRYTWPEPKWFIDFVDSVYAMYKMPIWITEFAVADWFAKTSKSTRYTEDQVIKFMHEVLPALDARPFVIRYSWFSADINDKNLWFSALYREDGGLTELGKVYAQY